MESTTASSASAGTDTNPNTRVNECSTEDHKQKPNTILVVGMASPNGENEQSAFSGLGNGGSFFSFGRMDENGEGATKLREIVEKARQEQERLSLFNKDGSAKSHEEIYKIGVEKQWVLVSAWFDKIFGIDELTWLGNPLFKENIARLSDMGFKLLDHSPMASNIGRYRFKYEVDTNTEGGL